MKPLYDEAIGAAGGVRQLADSQRAGARNARADKLVNAALDGTL